MEGTERHFQFLSGKVYNKPLSVLSSSVKHFQRLCSAYRNCLSIRKYLNCTKLKYSSAEKLESHDIQSEEGNMCCIFILNSRQVFRTQILNANSKGLIV